MISTKQLTFILATISTMVLTSCGRTISMDYSQLISTLERGEEVEINELLWQPENASIEYLPIATKSIQKFRKVDGSMDNLSIHRKLEKGRFQMLIFHIPWTKDGIPYSPLIMDMATSKIVGIMLPFNELDGHLTKQEHQDVGSLAIEWTRFAVEYRLHK